MDPVEQKENRDRNLVTMVFLCFRVPELNVQNGVLKSLSFMFEYIGEMAKDYIYAVTPLLEDALMERYLSNFLCNLILHKLILRQFVTCSLGSFPFGWGTETENI